MPLEGPATILSRFLADLLILDVYLGRHHLSLASIHVNREGKKCIFGNVLLYGLQEHHCAHHSRSSYMQLYGRNFFLGYVLRKVLCAPEKVLFFLILNNYPILPFRLDHQKAPTFLQDTAISTLSSFVSDVNCCLNSYFP